MYMAENPVIAGYVQKSCEWPWLYPSEWKYLAKGAHTTLHISM